MKKVFSLFAAVAMLSMALVSCGGNDHLKELAKKANDECPISMGMMGEISSIEFDGKDIVYFASVDEDWVDLDVMKENKEEAKQGILQYFTAPSKDVDEMLKELEKSDAGIKYVYEGKKSGKKVEIRLTVKEIKDAIANPMNPEELLAQDVRVTNDECPMEVDEGMVITEILIEGSDVVYVCQVDETLFDMDDFETNREAAQAALEEYMASLANDPSGKAFLNHCKNAGKDIVYRYQGTTTGKVSDFRIQL